MFYILLKIIILNIIVGYYNGSNIEYTIKIMIKKGLANKYSKVTDKNTSRLVNLEKINNTFSHKNKQ